MASKLRFKLSKALGRDRKNWPVTVHKIEQHGSGLKISVDRGRRIQNPETDEREYEFMKESQVTIPIERKYLQTGPGNHPLLYVVKISGEDKDYYIPVDPSLDFDLPEEAEQYVEDDQKISFLVKHSEFIKVAKNELEKHYSITQEEQDKWYQDPMIQAAILFFGAGLFFFFAAMGYSKMITQPFIEASKNFPEIATGMIPLMAASFRERWH